MGVKKLFQLIEKHVKKVSIEKYSGKKIAIDGNSFVHSVLDISYDKIMVIKGEYDRDSIYLECLEDSVKKLFNIGVKPIFFFDGSNPIEKMESLEERKDERNTKRNLSENRYTNNLYELIRNIKQDPYRPIKNVKKISNQTTYNPISEESNSKQQINIPFIFKSKIVESEIFHENALKKLNIYHIPIFCDILQSFKIPCYKREGEADRNISLCVNNELAHVAMSDDTDCLAFGSNILLYKIELFLKYGYILEINLREVLKQLNLTYSQFVDLCILLGCDYSDIYFQNDCKIVLNLINKYKCLENIHKNFPNLISLDQLNRATYARAVFHRGCIKSNNIHRDLMDKSYLLIKWSPEKENLSNNIKAKENIVKSKYTEIKELEIDEKSNKKNKKEKKKASETHVSFEKQENSFNLQTESFKNNYSNVKLGSKKSNREEIESLSVNEPIRSDQTAKKLNKKEGNQKSKKIIETTESQCVLEDSSVEFGKKVKIFKINNAWFKLNNVEKIKSKLKSNSTENKEIPRKNII